MRVDRAARELRGCGHLFAIRYHEDCVASADPAAVSTEGGDFHPEPPAGLVWLHGTARVCIRPFGHDGSVHSGWDREHITDKPRHTGPRVWFKQAVRADERAAYLATMQREGRL